MKDSLFIEDLQRAIFPSISFDSIFHLTFFRFFIFHNLRFFSQERKEVKGVSWLLDRINPRQLLTLSAAQLASFCNLLLEERFFKLLRRATISNTRLKKKIDVLMKTLSFLRRCGGDIRSHQT